MDYKYIEQLLERYWAAETSVEEEHILQAFFAQREVPAHLAQWQPLFQTLAQEGEAELGADFDKRLMMRLQPRSTWSVHHTLRRVYAVAATVAVFFLVGVGAHYVYKSTQPTIVWDYDPASYHDSYDNPEMALDESVEALRILQQQLHTIVNVDTTKVTSMK